MLKPKTEKMKKPAFIMCNDIHLETGNEEAIVESFIHLINHAQSINVKDIVLAGDLFESRSFQRQKLLTTFDNILERFRITGLTMHLFAGNHDKTLYTSFDSFLDVYRYHPAVKFNRKLERRVIGGVTVDLLPFFDDSMLVPMLEEAEGCDMLISHFEMQGSSNLGRDSKKTNITEDLLSKWKKVYLGHYHNFQEITPNIAHLPSFRQKNFGEDANKGFSVIYTDLSFEIIRGKFKEFTKLVVNVNDTNLTEIKELAVKYKDNENTIRIEFEGDETKLKALDKSIFSGTGIDVKIKHIQKYDFKDINLVVPKIVSKYGKEQVKTTFKAFCEEKGFKHSEGLELLEEFLKEK